MFINFKLKVHAAKDAGLDTVSKFKYELNGYRAQLARPYMTDQSKLDELMKEAYAHMQEEVRASHILIECKPEALAADTLKAWNKAMEARKKILAGEKFADVAVKYSTDPSVKKNFGDLGYFTAFQMVYPFEKGAYDTKVGETSMPIRTKYGYHIIQVTGRRPARGEIHVSHIMVKPQKEGDKDMAEIKINEIYQKALEGKQTFEELCSLYSDDVTTKNKGGELPWFGTNKMVSEFEEAAFGLKADKEISKPFKTTYGWHIVKRTGYKPVPAYTAVEKEIKTKVSKDTRAEQTRASFLKKIGKEYGFVYNEKYAPVKAARVAELAAIRATAIKTESGLEYNIIKKGAGVKPADGANVYIHYAGYLEDGSLFDSSYEEVNKVCGKYDKNRADQNGYQPFPFQYGKKDGLIPGFIEGLYKLSFGDKAVVFIPSKLGYGERGAGNVIPPNANIIFEIELLEGIPPPVAKESK